MDMKKLGQKVSQTCKCGVEKGIGAVLGVYTKESPCQPSKLIYAAMKLLGVTKTIEGNEQEEYRIKSYDGCELYVNVIKARPDQKKDDKKRVVITVHGISVCHYTNYRYAKIFLDKGFDVVLYDQRHEGVSEHGKYKCTMGPNEARDCGEVAKWVRQKYGDDVILGIHGESLGAATVTLYAPNDPNLAFAIEDCGFSSMEQLTREVMHRYLPFLDADNIYATAKKIATVGDVTYDDAAPIEAVRKMSPDVPMMFVHGAWDFFIPHHMAMDMYDAKPGKKKLRITPFAIHALSVDTNKKKYTQQVYDFFKENDIDC